MREFTRILCAVDYSERSRRALDCALWWARWHGAGLSVLHVHEQAEPSADSSVTGADAAAAPVVPPAPLSPQERDALVQALEGFVAGHRTDGVQVELLLEEATRVADAVLARADALACGGLGLRLRCVPGGTHRAGPSAAHDADLGHAR